MKKIIQLMNNFEDRNNISIEVSFFSDGSANVKEFWDDELLNESKNLDELQKFLMNTQYAIGDDGRCLSPCRVVE